MSLFKLSAKGAFWLGLLRVTIKTFSFLKFTLVARILTPNDFGLFAMITIPYGLIEVATETGINQALIQKKQAIKTYFTSAWIVFALRGLVIFLALWFSAPLISRIFNQDLTQAIRLISLAPLIKGLVNPRIILFQKNLNFKKEYIYKSLSSVAESIITIVLAVNLKSMLALPLGTVAGAVFALILSFFMTKIVISPISFSKIKKLYSYGKWVTLGTIFSYLNDQGDDFIVGKILGSQSLGFYQNAYKISNLPTTQGASLIYQIVFPIFSSIQNNFKRLKRGVIKSLSVTALASLSFAAVIYLLAPLFIRYILGNQWQPMLPALNVLIIFGVLRPLISVGNAFFDAVGRPQISSFQAIIKLAVMFSLVYPLTQKHGIIGTSWSVVIAQASVFPIFFYFLIKSFKNNAD